ncbi:sensor histidine kinase, partial [Bacteroidota bacterium]
LWNENKYTYSIIVVTSINIVLLMLIEIFNQEKYHYAYPSNLSRIIDVYQGVLIFSGIIFILINNAKTNLIRQYEKAKESDRLKTTFLANLSHEIRTPLNAVVGFSSILENEKGNKIDRKQYYKIIKDNSFSLLHLIDDIMDLSKIEANQLRVTKTPVNINLFLRENFMVHQHLLQDAGKKHLGFELDIPEEEPEIYTDITRLEQIINNLVNNAIKFTREGGIKIGYKKEDNHLLIFVSDTGLGIEKENQELIFKRFVKMEYESLGVRYSGAGIGLSLVRDLVRLLGGEIWVESEPGEGSVFYFTLPVNKTQ